MESWFDGVDLLGKFGVGQTGCWLLHQGGEAAILEMPPYRPGRGEASPARAVEAAVRELGLRVRHLLCSHAHEDHFSTRTLAELRDQFPEAEVHLHRSFAPYVGPTPGRIRWFSISQELDLAGEPLFLVHAPKHSLTDTMVIFRGTICTGDWELQTIRSIHDGRSGVTTEQKEASIQRLHDFLGARDYRVHQLYSAHANDRRCEVDFERLLQETRQDSVIGG